MKLIIEIGNLQVVVIALTKFEKTVAKYISKSEKSSFKSFQMNIFLTIFTVI